MRLTNICDKMNVSGCTELHNWEATGTGLNHFVYIYQIELAVISGVLLSMLIFYIIGKKINNSYREGEKNKR